MTALGKYTSGGAKFRPQMTDDDEVPAVKSEMGQFHNYVLLVSKATSFMTQMKRTSAEAAVMPRSAKPYSKGRLWLKRMPLRTAPQVAIAMFCG